MKFFDFKHYKTIVDAEVEAFNNICIDISNEIETNSKIIEEHQALRHRTDINEEIDKMKVKNSQLKIILSNVHHITAEHFAYSSLEALKNIVQPEIRYSRLESYSNIVPESLYIHNVYTFPHNVETDVKFIDDNLVTLFEDIFQCENIRAIHQFLNNYPEIKDECLNLFNESPKAGIVKLTEYLDKVNLYCPMLYKKNILNEIK